MVQETVWVENSIQVPEPEFFRHTDWFQEEMEEQREQRRDRIVTAAGFVMVAIMIVITLMIYGGY